MAFVFTGSFVDSKKEAEEGARVLLNKVLAATKNVCGGKNGHPHTKKESELPKDLPTLVDSDRVKYPIQYPQIKSGLDFPSKPSRLDQERDDLDEDWVTKWKRCTIEFYVNEKGASVYEPAWRIMIGPFFLKPKYTVSDLEKIILHEYLHTTLRVKPSSKEFKTAYDHGQIEQILIHNLHYHPPATPGGVS